jgi:large conductance mechanosensitive channel
MKKFVSEFKDFAMKGNMIDMAIGVVIGGAFSKIVTMIVDCIITPLISLILSALTGAESTDALFGSLAVGPFPVGQLVSSIIDFIITALVLFVIVKSINQLNSIGRKEEEPAAPTTKECPFCHSEIHIDATRCPHCTSQLDK